MRWRLLAPWVLTVLSGCATAAAPSDWRTWDLGDFSLRTPAAMSLVTGGIDSQAGTLSADGLRIEYDYGLYSDPLIRSSDRLDYRSNAGTVDGLAARFVQFRVKAPAQSCSGVHVPGVRASGTSTVALTVLACASTADLLQPASAIFATIRFKGTTTR